MLVYWCPCSRANFRSLVLGCINVRLMYRFLATTSSWGIPLSKAKPKADGVRLSGTVLIMSTATGASLVNCYAASLVHRVNHLQHPCGTLQGNRQRGSFSLAVLACHFSLVGFLLRSPAASTTAVWPAHCPSLWTTHPRGLVSIFAKFLYWPFHRCGPLRCTRTAYLQQVAGSWLWMRDIGWSNAYGRCRNIRLLG